MKAVIDTNVLVSGIFWKGPPFKILLGIILSFSFVNYSASFSEPGILNENDSLHPACKGDGVLHESRKFGNYEVRISIIGDWDCVSMEVRGKSGNVLYRNAEIGGHFYFGSDWQKSVKAINVSKGFDNPNLIMSSWSGGAHCCFSLHVFELGDQFKKIADIDAGNYYPFFKDLDHDGIPEIIITDDFLANVFSSFNETATGEVILKHSRNQYEVDAKHMKKPLPDIRKFEPNIVVWRKKFRNKEYTGDAPISLIQTMTDLVFTGNKSLAFDILEKSWPEEKNGKQKFIQDYKDALNDSKYYREFVKQL